jgi:hypothetical protein
MADGALAGWGRRREPGADAVTATPGPPGAGNGSGAAAGGSWGCDGAECPIWCIGCEPGDVEHRGKPTTVGTERDGWLTTQWVQLHSSRRKPRMKVTVTRHGQALTTQLSEVDLPDLLIHVCDGSTVLRPPRSVPEGPGDPGG